MPTPRRQQSKSRPPRSQLPTNQNQKSGTRVSGATMGHEEEVKVGDGLMKRIACHQMAYSAEPLSSSGSEADGMLRFVTDSQSPKVMFLHRTSFSAEHKPRSSRKRQVPLPSISQRILSVTIQTPMKNRAHFMHGGMHHAEREQARVLRNCCTIQPILSMIKLLLSLSRLVATKKHYKGQSFCRMRRMWPFKQAMLVENCVASYSSPKSKA